MSNVISRHNELLLARYQNPYDTLPEHIIRDHSLNQLTFIDSRWAKANSSFWILRRCACRHLRLLLAYQLID